MEMVKLLNQLEPVMNNFLILLVCCYCDSCTNPTVLKNVKEMDSTKDMTVHREKILRDSVKSYSALNSVDLTNSPSPSLEYEKNGVLAVPTIEINNFDNDSFFISEVTIKIKNTTIKIVEDVNMNSYIFNQNNQFFRIRYLSEMLTRESDLRIDYKLAKYYLLENSTKIAIVAAPERWSGLADSFVLCQIVDIKKREFIQVVKKRVK